jgi:hypothetical protein
MLVGARGKCPHCRTTVKFEPPRAGWNNTTTQDYEVKRQFSLECAQCPSCNRPVILITEIEIYHSGSAWMVSREVSSRLVWLRTSSSIRF